MVEHNDIRNIASLVNLSDVGSERIIIYRREVLYKYFSINKSNNVLR